MKIDHLTFNIRHLVPNELLKMFQLKIVEVVSTSKKTLHLSYLVFSITVAIEKVQTKDRRRWCNVVTKNLKDWPLQSISLIEIVAPTSKKTNNNPKEWFMDPLAYRLFPEATWRASLLHKQYHPWSTLVGDFLRYVFSHQSASQIVPSVSQEKVQPTNPLSPCFRHTLTQVSSVPTRQPKVSSITSIILKKSNLWSKTKNKVYCERRSVFPFLFFLLSSTW
jgi:hypothetical protein